MQEYQRFARPAKLLVGLLFLLHDFLESLDYELFVQRGNEIPNPRPGLAPDENFEEVLKKLIKETPAMKLRLKEK